MGWSIDRSNGGVWYAGMALWHLTSNMIQCLLLLLCRPRFFERTFDLLQQYYCFSSTASTLARKALFSAAGGSDQPCSGESGGDGDKYSSV